MDWISDYHLSKLKSEESGMDGEKLLFKFASQRNDIQEKCIKVCFFILKYMTLKRFISYLIIINSYLYIFNMIGILKK